MLKDAISLLQVDMLDLKHLSEKLRSEPLKMVQTSVESMNSDILQCTHTVNNCVTKANSANTLISRYLQPIDEALKTTQSRVTKLEYFIDNAKLLIYVLFLNTFCFRTMYSF